MANRHFFAGVNSPEGFCSRFGDIAADKACRRKIYIKGGPGTGKSTVMKKIAKIAEDEGYRADVFHCSSDPASLDGVYIDGLKTAVTDATAPHNSDPVYPGVSGEIFNCAEFLDSEALKENAEEIIHYSEHKKALFEKAYNYMRAASAILSDISREYKNSMYLHGIDLEAEKIKRRYLPDITMPKEGRLRRLFISAVTPNGFENHMQSVFGNLNVITVKGGYGADILIGQILDCALSRGFSAEAFYCPMSPRKLEHIVIRDTKTVFTTYNSYHHYVGNETIDLDEYITSMPLGTDNAHALAGSLLNQAVNALSEAKAAHAFLESFYVPAMDFEALEKKADEMTDSIFD